MKKTFAIMLCLVLLLAGCQKAEQKPEIDGVQIKMTDSEVTVDGKNATDDNTKAVYVANDIVYYESGKYFTYGEGTKADEHDKSEADAHTVVHITKAGTYVLSGELSAGQVAVDLGENAEENPDAVVTIVLNDVDITCTVAPAIIFYNVYECGNTDEKAATKDVDTKFAGANIMIADGTENNINGSYVARIYKSYELSEDGTEVVDSKKLHKYDGALYSKKSMNINGGVTGDGVLNIKAENEGLDSELHLTVNGGNINIVSGNDGINTNEDNVSVTTINGGNLSILVDGATGEGDGIDSNGWLVINGGTVTAQACSTSGDAGIDSDMGIYINGGTVVATGNMFDRIAGGESTYVLFSFANRQTDDSTYCLKNVDNKVVGEYKPTNDFTYLFVAGEYLVEGDYTLWQNNTQLSGAKSQGAGMGEIKPPMGEDFSRPEDMERPEDFSRPDGQPPEKPNGERPEMPNGERPEMPEGMENMMPPDDFSDRKPMEIGGENSTTFTIVKGANQFSGICPATTTTK